MSVTTKKNKDQLGLGKSFPRGVIKTRVLITPNLHKVCCVWYQMKGNLNLCDIQFTRFKMRCLLTQDQQGHYTHSNVKKLKPLFSITLYQSKCTTLFEGSKLTWFKTF